MSIAPPPAVAGAPGPAPTATAAEPAAVRVTVVGPERRGDLALPLAVTVGSLLPMLGRRLAEPPASASASGEATPGEWALQRVGDPPLPPDATVAAVELADGEVLHLVPADAPLAELVYDDVPDGLADAVRGRAGRWTPAATRVTLLLLAGVAALLLAVLVVRPLTVGGGVGPAAGLALAAQGWTVALAATVAAVGLSWARVEVRSAVLVTGLVGSGFAAVAGLGVGRGLAGVLAPDAGGLLVAGTCLLAQGVALAVLARGGVVVWGTVALVGVLAALGGGLVLLGLTAPSAAVLVAVGAHLLATLGPRTAVRLARLRVPLLPRTSEELQTDVDPLPGARLGERAGTAEDLLVAAVAAAAATGAVAAGPLCGAGWAGAATAAVLGLGMLLQARVFVAAAARGALLAGGTATLVVVVLAALPGVPSPLVSALCVLVVLALGGGAVAATLRAPGQRLLPVWGHTADVAETLAAVALVPLSLQVLGLFGLARGIFG